MIDEKRIDCVKRSSRPRTGWLLWTVLSAACWETRGDQAAFTEVMYHPSAGMPEYIEISNLTATPLDMADWTLGGGVDFSFPSFDAADPRAAFLYPREVVVVSEVPGETLRESYAIPEATRIFGPWTGSLDNGGERLVLRDANGVTLCTLEYDDAGRWPVAADGTGHSLELIAPDREVDDRLNWTYSGALFGSPGVDRPAIPPLREALRFNEVRLLDAGTVEWVEFQNISATVVDLDGLFLTDTPEQTNRIPLSGLVPPHGRLVLDVALPFDRSKTLRLFAGEASGTVIAAAAIKTSADIPDYQAFPDGSDAWHGTASDTRNAANNPVRNTDIVINEIMFDPPSNESRGEFVELFNRGLSAVDISGWRFDEGIDFTITTGTILEPGAFLVVAGNPKWLADAYGIDNVLGPFGGKLANTGEMLRLVDGDGNPADSVDYHVRGDWPGATNGDGSSLELIHPTMNNSLSSAWAASDEGAKSDFKDYRVTGTFEQLKTLGAPTDYKEIHLHLVGDGHVEIADFSLRLNGTGANLINNADVLSETPDSSLGWVAQGTHWASFIDESKHLHLVADGHGDNRANRVEIDATAMEKGMYYEIGFRARWISGKPRLIVQTWDHSIGASIGLGVPRNLGTPGAVNSAFSTTPLPQVEDLRHKPAVPSPADQIVFTARVEAATQPDQVFLWHRPDTTSGDADWTPVEMLDNGTGEDAIAGDGVFTTALDTYQTLKQIVQYYVEATGSDGAASVLPRRGADEPAMLIVDDAPPTSDLRRMRFIMSASDLVEIQTRDAPTEMNGYRFPLLSNHYFNATLIVDESTVYHGCEIRESGSAFSRGGTMRKWKLKLPEDRLFRGNRKLSFDDDPTEDFRRHHNRLIRHLLHRMGIPVNENEYVSAAINDAPFELREETEAVGNDFLNRVFANGTDGLLFRIDDQAWVRDNTSREYDDARWVYKDSNEPHRYRTEWMMRSREAEDDYGPLIEFLRLVDSEEYTQAQIERLIDPIATLKMAAVRGYAYDWDSFTLNRGKNGYFYRRPDDGRFMFLHWDSDLAFQSANWDGRFLANETGFEDYANQPYNLKRFKYYIHHIDADLTRESARMAAWFDAEEAASADYTVDRERYESWFTRRADAVTSYLGGNRFRDLNVSAVVDTTSEATTTIGGFAGYDAFDVRIVDHPEAKVSWDGVAWTAGEVALHEGENQLTIRTIDDAGTVLDEKVATVERTTNGAPAATLTADPASWRVEVGGNIKVVASEISDPEGEPVVHTWTLAPETDAAWEINDGEINAVFQKPGIHTLTLRLEDTSGNTTFLNRDIHAYAADDFEPFNTGDLGQAWNIENLQPRSNDTTQNDYSADGIDGRLTLRTSNTAALPLDTESPSYPALTRLLPASGDWAFLTKVRLESLRFSDVTTGLLVKAVQSGTAVRFTFGIDRGSRVVVSRIGESGTVTEVAAMPWTVDEVVLRVRRSTGSLDFELLLNETWTTVATVPFPATDPASHAGLFVATGTPLTASVSFDHALLIDPTGISQLRQWLRITEIMYHPFDGEDHEYVELTNTGPEALQLAGVRFTEGIDYVFPGYLLGAGQRVVIAANRTLLAALYGSGVPLAPSSFEKSLGNAGETLTLVDADGNLILSLTYSDGGDWPGRADGDGSSITLKSAALDWNDPDAWRASVEFRGNPGTEGLAGVDSVVINEVLTHTDSPLEDAIELHNPTAVSVDVSGWFLSDERSDLRRFRIPDGTVIPAGGYAVFYEYQFNDPASPTAFALSSSEGDEVNLVSADANGTPLLFVDRVEFDAAANGVSFGRFPNGSGELTPMAQLTLGSSVTAADAPSRAGEFRNGAGAENGLPKVGPIVFSRIMYEPDATGGEFIELVNIDDATVPLHDPGHPANTWRFEKGIDFVFPTGIEIAPDERFLVVPTEPETFRSAFRIDPDVRIFGPWSGRLDNGGEKLALYRPDGPVALPTGAFVPYYQAEYVDYDNRAPWPDDANGTGRSIDRVLLDYHGNSPGNWITADGSSNDVDHDGLPDDWEEANGFDPANPNDARADFDGDGHSNLEEFLAGTDPRDPASTFLLFIQSPAPDGTVTLNFEARTGRSYTVYRRDAAETGEWILVRDLAPPAEDGFVEVVDTTAFESDLRFYRVVTRREEN